MGSWVCKCIYCLYYKWVRFEMGGGCSSEAIENAKIYECVPIYTSLYHRRGGAEEGVWVVLGGLKS